MLLTSGCFRENYLRNKLVKLIVDIARHEHPHQWPSFIRDIFDLATVSPFLSLLLTKTTVEEFFGTRTDISDAQSKSIRAAISSSIYDILNGVIIYNLQNGYNALSGVSPVADSPLFAAQKAQISSPYPSPTFIVPLSAEEFKTNSKLGFEILQLLIASVPNQDPFWTEGCMDVILKHSLVDPNDYDWTFAVLQCLEELFAKPTIPLGATAFLPRIMDTLSSILQDHSHQFRSEMVDQLPDGYTTKLIDLLESIVSNHFSPFKIMSKEKLEQLIVDMVQFTFSLSSIDDAISMMNLWETLIENVGTTMEGFDSLVLQLLEKLLQEPRYQVDGVIDVSHLILDICAMIAQNYPDPTINLLCSKYRIGAEIAQQLINSHHLGSIVAPIFKELSMVVLGLGRLATTFEDDFTERFQFALDILNQNIVLADLISGVPGCDLSVYHLSSNIFECLNMFVNWIAKFQSMAVSSAENILKYEEFVQTLLTVALKTITTLPQSYCISSSRFLSHSSGRLKPNLQSINGLEQFMQSMQQGFIFQNMMVFSNVWKFVTNYFVCFPNGYKPAPQDWNERSTQFHEFLNPVLQNIPAFFSLDMNNADQEDIKRKLLFSFLILQSVCLAVKDGQQQTRDVGFKAIGDVIAPLPQFLEIFKNDIEGLCKVTELLTDFIDVFKKQLAKSSIASVVPQTLLWCQAYILHSESTNEMMNQHCFKLFDMLIEDKSKLFDSVLPNMISFCVQLHDQTNHNSDSEKLGQLYSLIDRILYYHWNYFFPSKVSTMMKGNQVEHTDDFLALFQVIWPNQILVQSFYTNETDLIRQNIINIRNLHSQWKLFEQEYFKSQLVTPFVLALFDVIFSKRIPALDEDFINQLCDVIESDLDAFKEKIGPVVLQSKCDHFRPDQQQTLVGHIQNIKNNSSIAPALQALINDYTFFFSENSS